jgi:hypothetical protein
MRRIKKIEIKYTFDVLTFDVQCVAQLHYNNQRVKLRKKP